VRLPAERHKPVTALANAQPITGAQQARGQALHWFLSAATWEAAAVTRQRLAVLGADPAPAPAPDPQGGLVLDETGDRKGGTKTAPIGRQELGSIGKVDRGGVTVSSLGADARVSDPLTVEPFTPRQHCARGRSDPADRTKPQIALALVQQAVAAGLPLRGCGGFLYFSSNSARFEPMLAKFGSVQAPCYRNPPAPRCGRWWPPASLARTRA
jgi:SRSO17 transposase